MKKIKLLSLAILSACCLASAVFAQPPPAAPPADSGTFLGSVGGYFTAFNPALEGQLTNHNGTLWTSPDWQAGAHVSTSLGLEYTIWKNFALTSETRFGDVSGTIAAQQFGVAYNVNIHDVRLSGGIAGAYNTQLLSPSGAAQNKLEPVLTLSAIKLLTEHTYTGLAMEIPINKSTQPMFQIRVGFLF